MNCRVDVLEVPGVLDGQVVNRVLVIELDELVRVGRRLDLDVELWPFVLGGVAPRGIRPARRHPAYTRERASVLRFSGKRPTVGVAVDKACVVHSVLPASPAIDTPDPPRGGLVVEEVRRTVRAPAVHVQALTHRGSDDPQDRRPADLR